MRRKTKPPGRNQAGEMGTKIDNGDNAIIPHAAPPVNSQHYKIENSPLATTAQVTYLQALRRRVGLADWNRVKSRLNISTPGTHNLTVREAAALINEILTMLERTHDPV